MLIFEEDSRDSNSTTFQRLSATIGRFFVSSITQRFRRRHEKYRQRLQRDPLSRHFRALTIPMTRAHLIANSSW
jgi:hypothetical protein